MRETLKIVVTGHVDHGKSTVIGRLLHDTESLPSGALEKVRRIAKETGKPFELAYLLDAFEEEQQQGITIDTTQLQFQTKKRDYVIIDAPGHKEFLKNMISGAADAEAAFLVIDASRGVEEQSRRHAYMLSLLGIRTICVLVNKMDLVAYDQNVFTNVQKDMAAFLKTLGVEAIEYIPLSALQGENILQGSPNLGWYKGHSLIQALDAIPTVAADKKGILRFPIQDVYKFDTRRIIAGRIESGTINVGDEILIQPGNKRTKVLSIPTWPKDTKKQDAYAGESIGITVADEFFNKRGEIICLPSSPIPVAKRFRASIFWLGREELVKEHKYTVKIATQEYECKVTEIVRVVDASTLEGQQGQSSVKLNDVAEVWIETKELLAIDTFAVCRGTGRFVLIDTFNVAGGGIVVEVDTTSTTKTVENIFVHKKQSVACELFDEYFCDALSGDIIRKSGDDVAIHSQVFTVGDKLPLHGNSYSYPESFDIIDIESSLAIHIRNRGIETIESLDTYGYSDLPLLNRKGFAFNIHSAEEWKQWYEACKSKQQTTPLSQSLDFEKYRKVIFSVEE